MKRAGAISSCVAVLVVALGGPAAPASASGTIDTVVGAYNPAGAPATEACLNKPHGATANPAGGIYFTDMYYVFQMDSLGQLSIVAGNGTGGGYTIDWSFGDGGPATSAALNYPSGVAVDDVGNVYIADTMNQRVRRVDAATQVIVTVAGNGTEGFSGDGGPATSAALGRPHDLALDSAGNLYIAEAWNNRVRKVDAATQTITTVAGNGARGYSGDGGPATDAMLNLGGGDSGGIALDGAGNLYIADYNNWRVRKVDAATGIITTVAGNGTTWPAIDTGPALDATVYPLDVTVDSAENLLVVEELRVRKIDAITGMITTVAGNGNWGFSGDGGPATSATFKNSAGVAVDGEGDLFITDSDNHRLRKVDTATGIITTVAGSGAPFSFGENRPALTARICGANAIMFDGAENLYFAEMCNSLVRKVDADTGILTTVAGNGSWDYSGDGGPATSAGFGGPLWDLKADAAGNLYIADAFSHRIRKVDAVTGIITTIAGNGTRGYSGDGGPAINAMLNYPWNMVFDSAGNLYISDYENNRVRKIDAATGVITTVVGSGTAGYAGDGGLAADAQLDHPWGVAFDAAENLYVADYFNNRIRKVDALTGVITTVAGNGTEGYGGDGGPAMDAMFTLPFGIALDAAGNLYISDEWFPGVRKVDAATGIITTVAGNGTFGYSGDGGPATAAAINYASSLAVDSAGDLYFTDQGNHRVRKVTFVSDTDNDGVPDGADNCLELANPLQANVDGDSAGDLCDLCPADALDTCDPNGSAAEEISASVGGVVQTADGGLSLVIPAGALDNSATISATETVITDPAANLVLATGTSKGQRLLAYDLEPAGTTFSWAIELTIVVDLSTLNANQRSRLDIYLENAAGELEPVADSVCGIDLSTNVANCTTWISHFSVYVVAAPADTDNDGVFDQFDGVVDVCPAGPNVVNGLLAPMAALAPDGDPAVLPDNAFKAGRSLPLKLDYLCGTIPLTDQDEVAPPQLVSIWRVGDAEPLPIIDPDSGEANDSGVWFRYSNEHWIYNYKTTGLSEGTYDLSIRMPDGRVFKGGFVLK